MGNSSFWKKEISLRRRQEDASQPEPEAVEPEAETVADAPELPAGGDYGWLTANFDPEDIPHDMPAVAPPPVTELPPPAAVAQPAPLPDVPTVTPPPVQVPAPGPQPEPVSAPELPAAAAVAVEAAPDPSVPFWKKEISLGRSKAPKEPKQKKEQAPKDGTPFWKKELSLSRSKAPKAPKEPKQKQEKAPKDGTPFWKRELSLSRSKAPEEPKQPKQPKPKDGTPFWKKEMSFSKAPKATAAKGPSKGAYIGLKIGASQVAAARVSNGGAPQLLQVAREPLADGVVVGGELRDVEALSAALRELFTKNKLPKKNVRLGIANNRIGVRTFEITGIDEPRQLANAIRFRAQETLPIPLEEAVLDWQVLAEWQDEETGQTTRRVLLVVAYRELVDRYVFACKKAGLRLEGIDLEAFAMLRALNAPSAEGTVPANGAQVVVNVGHDRSTFAVSDGRVCEFTRVLSWGGQSLSVAIARVLDITPSEAAPIKHALSLVAVAEPPEGVSPETLATARDAAVRELQSFARELVSSLRFYQNQPGSLGIAEVVLTGGSAHLPGFADELGRLIGVPVRVGDPLNRVAVPKKLHVPDDVSVGSLTVAIGLGIDD